MSNTTNEPKLDAWQKEIELFLADKQRSLNQQKTDLVISQNALNEYAEKLITLQRQYFCHVCLTPADAPKYGLNFKDYVLRWDTPMYMAKCEICQRYVHVGNSKIEIAIPRVTHVAPNVIPARKACMYKGICKHCAQII